MKIRLSFFVLCFFLVFLSLGTNCRKSSTARENSVALTAPASALRQTIISAHLDVPMTATTNVLWCGTFQLAWNEISTLLHEGFRCTPSSPFVNALNQQSFTKTDLDENSYIAMAGFAGAGIHERIRQALEAKFHGAATTEYLPKKSLTSQPNDLVAYAHLLKNIQFPKPFERLEMPLLFAGEKVTSFGIGMYKLGHDALYPQVLILDYKDKNNFIIELMTQSEGDRVILAKIVPGRTLAETIAAARQRIVAVEGKAACMGDVLQIPKLNFDVTTDFPDLKTVRFERNVAGSIQPLSVISAAQNIRFLMDEKGVVLESAAHISVGCSRPNMVMPQHIMIFDQPFLILMQRREAKLPYFALWVANPELLVKK